MRDVWPVMLIGLGAFLLWRTSVVRRERTFEPGGTTGTDGPSGAGSTAGIGGTDSTKGNAKAADDRSTASTSSNSVLSAMAILGGVERRNNCQDFRGGDVTAIMGGCHIDLRGASITVPHEPVLEVFAMWGGIEIRVPPDWTVVSSVGPILGGYEDKTTPPKDDSKRFVVRGSVVMGGIEVKN